LAVNARATGVKCPKVLAQRLHARASHEVTFVWCSVGIPYMMPSDAIGSQVTSTHAIPAQGVRFARPRLCLVHPPPPPPCHAYGPRGRW
jgi:hypothetical protein